MHLGRTLLKVGEEARVGLRDFSLDGGDRKWMRKMQRRVESENCSFAIVDAEPILPELRAISDSWLTEKNTREKGFSLGFFAEDYVRRFPIAVVMRDDRIVAFAGVERMIDAPMKRYSSGLYARLGFSVAMHSNPDIVLVDEVLAVGDASFRLPPTPRPRHPHPPRRPRPLLSPPTCNRAPLVRPHL